MQHVCLMDCLSLQPSEKELLAGLKQYMNALTLIWNKHKDEYAQDRIEEMNFI